MSTICFHCHFFCPAMRDFLSATEKVWASWLMISSDIVIWILHQSWYLTIKKNANATLSSLYRSVQYRESWRKKTPVFLWFCSYFCDLVHVLHICELLNHMTTILQSWNNQYKKLQALSSWYKGDIIELLFCSRFILWGCWRWRCFITESGSDLGLPQLAHSDCHLDDICFIMILCCSINNYPFSSLLFKNPLHICERSKSAFSSFSYGWWSLRTSPQRIVSTIYRYANIVWFSKYRWKYRYRIFLPYQTIFLGHFLPIFTYFYL